MYQYKDLLEEAMKNITLSNANALQSCLIVNQIKTKLQKYSSIKTETQMEIIRDVHEVMLAYTRTRPNILSDEVRFSLNK